MAKILLAEDDENLGFMLQDNLSEFGHEVSWAKNGLDALETYGTTKFDVCIIDVMMPKMDGFELARNIREADAFVPLLFLTAKSMEEDKLKGFEIGADDYITKPFSIKELDYRITVFLKRSGTSLHLPKRTISFGHSTYDAEELVYTCGPVTHSLTEMEAKLLELLVQHQNQLIRREVILEKIWGENDYFKGRSLDVFITRLRKYLKEDHTLEIRNHHGVGFCLKIRAH